SKQSNADDKRQSSLGNRLWRATIQFVRSAALRGRLDRTYSAYAVSATNHCIPRRGTLRRKGSLPGAVAKHTISPEVDGCIIARCRPSWKVNGQRGGPIRTKSQFERT